MKPTSFQLIQLVTGLSLSSTRLQEAGKLVANLDEWSDLLRQAELYGVSNLLLRHINENDWAVPQHVSLALKALELRHRHAADARYKLMETLLATFAKEGIEVVALKGLALAPLIYPEDYLRPMRDIDILVPRQQEAAAGELLKQMGFDLPDAQPSKYMRDSHQLPNATIKVGGFTISVEVHHDAISRDVSGSLFYEQAESELQTVNWRDLSIQALGHEQMLHQLCKHLAALHPGAVLKMINVLDIVLYAEQYLDEIDWRRVKRQYSHVVNTLKCLDLIVPLNAELGNEIGVKRGAHVSGVGETMQPLSKIFSKQFGYREKLSKLLFPPDWWLHLYYNVSPNKSLFLVHAVRHPVQIAVWLTKRLFSRTMGG